MIIKRWFCIFFTQFEYQKKWKFVWICRFTLKVVDGKVIFNLKFYQEVLSVLQARQNYYHRYTAWKNNFIKIQAFCSVWCMIDAVINNLDASESPKTRTLWKIHNPKLICVGRWKIKQIQYFDTIDRIAGSWLNPFFHENISNKRNLSSSIHQNWIKVGFAWVDPPYPFKIITQQSSHLISILEITFQSLSVAKLIVKFNFLPIRLIFFGAFWDDLLSFFKHYFEICRVTFLLEFYFEPNLLESGFIFREG